MTCVQSQQVTGPSPAARLSGTPSSAPSLVQMSTLAGRTLKCTHLHKRGSGGSEYVPLPYKTAWRREGRKQNQKCAEKHAGEEGVKDEAVGNAHGSTSVLASILQPKDKDSTSS